MFSMDGILYRICTWIYNFAFLNVLFLISCIPIITIFPATAAVFGVARKLVHKEDPSIFTMYRKFFVENFKQSIIIGLIMTVIGAFLAEDFYLLTQMKTGWNLVIFVALLFVAINYLSTLLHVWPLMVNGYFTTKQLLINAYKFGIYKFHLTLFMIIVVSAMLFISLRFSFLLFFFYFAVSAYIIYWYADRKFSKVWKRDGEQQPTSQLHDEPEIVG